jgi:hypothetical protein
MRSAHQPKIIDLRNGKWMVECSACRHDHFSAVPIGIGMALPDRLTAERLAENHSRGRGAPVAGAQEPAPTKYLGHPNSREVAGGR